MGNKKKVGTRYKLCKKGGRKYNNVSKTNQQLQSPDSETRPRKASSSKVKLGPNLEYYEAKTETFDYEIVDIQKLENALADVAVCKLCGHCLRLTKKSLVGLATEITISCLNCNDLHKSFNNCNHINVKTSKNPECKAMTNMYDLNIRLVYGMRVIGKGLTSARTLCGIMNIPAPPTVFSKYEKVIGQSTDVICKLSMKEAVEEAVAVNINTESPRDLCVALDGSWQRRGHQSLNGIVSLTSVDTGKVMDFHCMSKHCLCPKKLEGGHLKNCIANYIGTSGGMESEGALKMFGRSLEQYNVRYTNYLGDGDSNAFLSVCNSKPYGEAIQINKLECIGHIQKRMGTRLRTLKQRSKKSKLADGKSLSGKNRLTDTAIQKLQIFYGLAIRRNCHSLSDMKQAVWATYFHVMSSDGEPTHELCPKEPTTWCKYNIALIENKEYDHDKHFHLPQTIMSAIKPIFKDLSNPELLIKCLAGKTQNPNESLNNLIWSRVPKRTFVSLNTLKFGAQDAVLSFNDGYSSKCKVIEHLGLKIGKHFIAAMQRLDNERIRKSEKAAEDFEKKIRQSRTLLKRKLEDMYEEAEDVDNPSYAAGEY